MMIGLIFDMDGVIVDNHEYHFRSWQQFHRQYNKDINEQDYKERINGRTMKAIIRDVFPEEELTDQQAKAYGDEKEAIYREMYKPHLAPTPGLIDFLELAKAEGIPMVIGTSAPKENVTFTIEGLGLKKYFETILDERAVTKGKPDPEIYEKCARAIGLPNRQCIVFEDALSGIRAGHSAGSKVVALATTHAADELQENTALVIPDFTELTVQQLRDLL